MTEGRDEALAQLPHPASVTTRLLLPFLLERRSALRAAELLCAAAQGAARQVWRREGPRRLYRYRLQMTSHLDRFLFSESGAAAMRGAYLHASAEETARWFRGAAVEVGGRRVGLELDAECGVELFLTAHGAGVLSIALRAAEPVDAATALAVNDRLARLTRPGEQAPWLTIAADDPADPPADPAAAVRDAPLAERLGRPGARFALTELVAQLLEPLRALGLSPIQDAFCAYTVVRLGPGLDPADARARRAAGRLASAFAQVEGLSHAPAGGAGGVPHVTLGARHWAAASLQGAAHVIADRPETAEDPVPRLRDRHFVPYLTALLQRCAIKKAAEEATELVVAERITREEVSALRSHVLEFVLAGALPEVSVRSQLHRFYRVCQRAADLRRNLGQVRRALADLDAQLATRQQMEIAAEQQRMASRSAEALESSHRIHVSLEWIEVFIVVAYAAELAKFFVIELPELEHVSERWTAGLLAVLPGVVALAILRPWRHAAHAAAVPAQGSRPPHGG